MKEILVKVLRETNMKYTVDIPEVSATYWKDNVSSQESFDIDKEHCVVLILDSKMHVKAHSIVSIGNLDSTVVHPREVFRPAIAYAGKMIILMHNHPSGTLTPSPEDIAVTREMKQAGDLLRIPFLDHIIVSSKGDSFLSLKQYGYLE